MRHNRRHALARKSCLHRPHLLAAALFISTPHPTHAQGSITDLGTLGGSGSTAYGVSADGTVVVGWSDTTGDAAYRAFRWTSSGGMVDLGTLGGSNSIAYGLSANGAVVVGAAENADTDNRAFRWTSGGMVDLGTLGGSSSFAYAVSADGAVVVGTAENTDADSHAFRWTSGSMVDLGTLGGSYSYAYGVSADGTVAVGQAQVTGNAAVHAFRWNSNDGMVDLNTLGGTHSYASGVSANGEIVVGSAQTTGNTAFRAFRWNSDDGMVDLHTLGGTNSSAAGVSANGAVVVGAAQTTGDAAYRAYRWTQGTGMQSVEDWLRANGVAVSVDITAGATTTNSDGSVVVGYLENNHAFIARVSSIGSGLVTLQDVQQSLAGSAIGSNTALSSADLIIHGAHNRPLSRLVASGRHTMWIAGDWGRDDHGSRNGDLGLAEIGFGHNFSVAQINISLGQTWAQQKQMLNGRSEIDGTYLLAEGLIPVSNSLWATLAGYHHWGKANMKRGYLNAGMQDFSTSQPDVDTWSLRARLDWNNAWHVGNTGVSPYVDLSYSESTLAAYIETDGGFPARFDARKARATELRIGANAVKPLSDSLNLVGTLEATRRFEDDRARTSGQVIGLFSFDLDGLKNQQNWLRAGLGLEGELAGGRASLMFNATTRGEALNYWLAANWQTTF